MMLAIVLSFGAGFSLAIWRERPTMSVLVMIASPTVAVVVLVMLYAATLMVWRRMVRSNLGKRWDSRDSWLGLAFSLLVAAVAFGWSWVATMVVLNESVGVDIRSSSLFSKLPDGNLLLAGGMLIEGWVYFAVFAGMITFIFWNMIIVKFAKLKHWRPTLPSAPIRRPERASSGADTAPAGRRNTEIMDSDEGLSFLEKALRGNTPVAH